jgi:hypothetical protein
VGGQAEVLVLAALGHIEEVHNGRALYHTGDAVDAAIYGNGLKKEIVGICIADYIDNQATAVHPVFEVAVKGVCVFSCAVFVVADALADTVGFVRLVLGHTLVEDVVVAALHHNGSEGDVGITLCAADVGTELNACVAAEILRRESVGDVHIHGAVVVGNAYLIESNLCGTVFSKFLKINTSIAKDYCEDQCQYNLELFHNLALVLEEEVSEFQTDTSQTDVLAVEAVTNHDAVADKLGAFVHPNAELVADLGVAVRLILRVVANDLGVIEVSVTETYETFQIPALAEHPGVSVREACTVKITPVGILLETKIVVFAIVAFNTDVMACKPIPGINSQLGLNSPEVGLLFSEVEGIDSPVNSQSQMPAETDVQAEVRRSRSPTKNVGAYTQPLCVGCQRSQHQESGEKNGKFELFHFSNTRLVVNN